MAAAPPVILAPQPAAPAAELAPAPAPAIQIKSTRWYHERIIDLMLASEVPMSQNEIAKTIGYSATWVSIMVNSDAFKDRLAARKAELTDPIIAASINERLDGLAKSALDRLIKRVDISGDAIQTKDLVAIAKLSIGDKNTRVPPPAGPNLYVVNLPPTATNSKTWLENAQGIKREQGSGATHGSPTSDAISSDSSPPQLTDAREFFHAAMTPPPGVSDAVYSTPGLTPDIEGEKPADPLLDWK